MIHHHYETITETLAIIPPPSPQLMRLIKELLGKRLAFILSSFQKKQERKCPYESPIPVLAATYLLRKTAALNSSLSF
jgi:hypothetical protein